MNAQIIDPLQGDFPEVIEEFLEHGSTKCIAFNRRGTLLAAGCSDGSCVIWDFETRGVAKVLRDKDLVAPITSICWSKYGHKILVTALDNSLTLWDVVKSERVTRITLQQMVLQARLHPSSSPAICLVCSVSSTPMIVDLGTGNTTLLPVPSTETSNGLAPPPRGKSSDGSVNFTPPPAACFNKYGDLVYVGNSKGEILIIDYRNIQIRGIISVPGGSMIKNIIFSRNGQYLLTNSNDRTVRIYENLLPLKGGIKALDELKKDGIKALHELKKDEIKAEDELKSDLDKKKKDDQDELEILKATGLKCLSLFREFHDSITRVHWKAPCFSGDGEWVIGGSGSSGEHKIYIWDQAGYLVKILEGPKEKLIDLAWHPVHPIIVSVSLPGQIYIWAKDYTENWSAFAPDFKELEENEEYIEREDEFDLIPDSEKMKESDVNENDEIDIMTVEKDPAFSDSDTSVDEIRFLPADPIPDPPEQHDKYVGSTSKFAESTQSDSFSEEAGQNGDAVNHSSSPHEGLYNSAAEDTGGTQLKRHRNPSDKVSGSQADKVKKPSKKLRPSVK